jgi:hypothetical protein
MSASGGNFTNRSLISEGMAGRSMFAPENAMELWVHPQGIAPAVQWPLWVASSTDHGNTSPSLSAGVSKPKVFRER